MKTCTQCNKRLSESEFLLKDYADDYDHESELLREECAECTAKADPRLAAIRARCTSKEHARSIWKRPAELLAHRLMPPLGPDTYDETGICSNSECRATLRSYNQVRAETDADTPCRRDADRHHPDYRNPLHFVTLCISCHTKEHGGFGRPIPGLNARVWKPEDWEHYATREHRPWESEDEMEQAEYDRQAALDRNELLSFIVDETELHSDYMFGIKHKRILTAVRWLRKKGYARYFSKYFDYPFTLYANQKLILDSLDTDDWMHRKFITKGMDFYTANSYIMTMFEIAQQIRDLIENETIEMHPADELFEIQHWNYVKDTDGTYVAPTDRDWETSS